MGELLVSGFIGDEILPSYMCNRVDQLPLFPYNRGWETQPNSRGLNTHYKDSY